MRGFVDGEYQDGELRGLTFLAGMRGMGKTTEMLRLLAQCAGGVVFFDTTGKHAPQTPGYATFSQPGPLKEYLRRNLNRRFRIRYTPPKPMDFADEDLSGEEQAHMVAVCTIVATIGWIILAIDEVDRFCGEGKKGMPMVLYNLAHYGRHCGTDDRRGVSMLVTARDPATLGIKFRSQCEYMRLFRQDEERYVDYFAGRIGKENAAGLRNLPRYQYLLWQSGTSGVRVCGGRRSL